MSSRKHLKKSDIWTCFIISRDNPSFAKCNVNHCNSVISRGTSVKQYSTKPLWNHLKYKHREKYKTLAMRKLHGSKENQTEMLVNIQDGNDFPNVERLQQTPQDSTPKWGPDDRNARIVTKQICELIALDAQPYNIVERIGLKKFISLIAPRYEMPPQSYFSDIAMPRLYESIKNEVQKELDFAEFISFTAHVWINSMNISFVNLSASFIGSDMSCRHYTLKCQHFPNAPSTTNIAEVLCNTINEWDIHKKKIHLLLKDDAPEVFQFHDTGFTPLDAAPCAISVLQLVVQDAVFSQKIITDLVSKCSNIVDYFTNSSSNSEMYKKIEKSFKMHGLTDLQNLRWYSTYNMLRRLFELRKTIVTFSDGNEIPSMTPAEWTVIGQIVKVLMPIDEITKICAKDKEVISCVIPIIQALHSYLGREKKDNDTKLIKERLKKSLDAQFLTGDKNIQNRKVFVLATVLDPRFKINFIQNVEQARGWLLQEMTDLNQPDSVLNDRNEAINKANDDRVTPNDPTGDTNLWMSFQDITTKRDEPNDPICDTDTIPNDPICDTDTIPNVDNSVQANVPVINPNEPELYEDEINEYLKIPLVDKDSDPMLWWKMHETIFPNLKRCMIKYFSAPPASCSERKHEQLKNYIMNQNNLTPENIEILMFVMQNTDKK